ncbi:efflux transporter outer membrane subunit [Dyella sp. A6]|uniref:efflux transporter outer membrane subunit n=1 Tax=Dyella aluminiiresistens TaxID=3069105 RepID=UPI002E7840AA|nr:efflux transporter outer membrane subunit [Dyella sp. A6]
MRLHLPVAAVGLTLALAGCASSGGLHPQGAPIDPSSLATQQSLAQVSASEASWPQTDWWVGLGDAQLDALMTEALKNNPSLVVADARVRAAQAAAGVTHADLLPRVNAGASVAGARLPASVPALGNGHFGLAKYAYASFSWNPDLWGGRRAAWQAAVGEARAAEVEAHAARIELSGNLARAYVQLGYAYNQHDVAKAELQRARLARKLTRQRVDAGIDNRIQLEQSNAEVATAKQQLAQAGNAIDAARNALAALLGKGPDRGLKIARPQLLPPSKLAVPADLPANLIGHRADLVAARWRVEAAGKDIKAAKAEFLPNLGLSALAGVIGFGGGNILDLPSRFYTVAPALSLPIFDGGRLRNNLRGKDAQYDLAVAQYNQALVGAVNEVADDVDALRSLRQQVAAEAQALAAAREAWTLAEQRYKAGVGSYLEALTVRQQLLAAEQRMAALKAQQSDQSVQLIQALGGGYTPGNGQVPPATAHASAHTSSSTDNRS